MRSSCTPGHSSNEGQAPYTPRMGQKTTRFYTVLYLKNAQSAIGGAPSAWREQSIWHPPLRFCLKPNTPPQRSRLWPGPGRAQAEFPGGTSPSRFRAAGVRSPPRSQLELATPDHGAPRCSPALGSLGHSRRPRHGSL